MKLTNQLGIATKISGLGNKDCPTSLNKEKVLQFLNLEPSLQKTVMHKWRLNGTFKKYFGSMEPIACFKQREENWGPVYHGIESANRVSIKYPHIKLALFFHDADLITMKNTKFGRHAKAAATHARYMMQKLGFSKVDIRKVEALVRFHHYHLSKDMRSFRKLCMVAHEVDPDFNYKDFIRFKLADIDNPKQFKIPLSLLKKTLKYMKTYKPVFFKKDLDIDIERDVIFEGLNRGNKCLTALQNRLMNWIAYNGYEHNNNDELVMEINQFFLVPPDPEDSRVRIYAI